MEPLGIPDRLPAEIQQAIRQSTGLLCRAADLTQRPMFRLARTQEALGQLGADHNDRQHVLEVVSRIRRQREVDGTVGVIAYGPRGDKLRSRFLVPGSRFLVAVSFRRHSPCGRHVLISSPPRASETGTLNMEL